MEELIANKVEDLETDSTILNDEKLQSYHISLDNDWNLIENHHLTKRFEFENFEKALDFVNKVGSYAEDTNHHPEITFSWGYTELEIYTHKLDGLRKSDFVWAANVEKIYKDNY